MGSTHLSSRPRTLTRLKAGSSVPLKFSLGGDKGLKVLAAGFPTSLQFDCASLELKSERVATKQQARAA